MSTLFHLNSTLLCLHYTHTHTPLTSSVFSSTLKYKATTADGMNGTEQKMLHMESVGYLMTSHSITKRDLVNWPSRVLARWTILKTKHGKKLVCDTTATQCVDRIRHTLHDDYHRVKFFALVKISWQCENNKSSREKSNRPLKRNQTPDRREEDRAEQTIGQPGRIDNLLRKGFSGAGVRWSLAQCKSAEEARANSLERKKPQ